MSDFFWRMELSISWSREQMTMSVRSLNYIVAKAREKREAPSSGQLGIRRPANKINHNCDADTQNKRGKWNVLPSYARNPHPNFVLFPLVPD